MDIQFGTKGKSQAIHMVKMDKGFLVTACPALSIHMPRKEGLHLVVAEAATCKSCIKIIRWMEESA